jgi:hypothetical protein
MVGQRLNPPSFFVDNPCFVDDDGAGKAVSFRSLAMKRVVVSVVTLVVLVVTAIYARQAAQMTPPPEETPATMPPAGKRLQEKQRALNEAFAAYRKDENFQYQQELAEALKNDVAMGGRPGLLEALYNSEPGTGGKHMSDESTRRLKLLAKVLACIAERDEAWRALQQELKP